MHLIQNWFNKWASSTICPWRPTTMQLVVSTSSYTVAQRRAIPSMPCPEFLSRPLSSRTRSASPPLTWYGMCVNGSILHFIDFRYLPVVKISPMTVELSCYPGCFREPHWLPMGLPEISRENCGGCLIPVAIVQAMCNTSHGKEKTTKKNIFLIILVHMWCM